MRSGSSPRKSIAYTCGLPARTPGPFVPSHGIGRANLVAAFPEKAAAEIEQILVGVWDNLGRTAAKPGLTFRPMDGK